MRPSPIPDSEKPAHDSDHVTRSNGPYCGAISGVDYVRVRDNLAPQAHMERFGAFKLETKDFTQCSKGYDIW